MRKIKQTKWLLWAKRIACYLAGLFIMAVGVVFSVRSSLGVSPVTCLANVAYQILGVDRGLSFFGLGVCTTLVYCLYILAELAILRRAFQARMLLQILASTIFGLLVSLATRLLGFLPAPTAYPLRVMLLLCSIPLVALGVMLYLAPNILPTPGEGLSLAVAKRTGKSVASCKMITDCCLVACSAAVSLIYFRKLVGVREGTVVSALLVGFVLKRFLRVFGPGVQRFVARETKLERAAAAGTAAVSSSPKLLITISREYGSGGYEIGEKLAAQLGVTFYDRQLMPQEAAESGLPLDFIEAHEQRMSRSLVYDLMTAGYAMYNEDLPPLEKLFAAQSRILRRIAASGESCVIMGRCSDYILYQEPDSFRVFIHAPVQKRAERVARLQGISMQQALREVEKTDQSRARYYQQFAGREWGNTKYYHLAVDSDRFGVDHSVALICDAVRLWRENGASPAE